MIFEPLVGEGFEWVNASDERDYEVFLTFDGKPRGRTWQPLVVRRVRADERQALKPSDFPWLGSHALVMRRKSVDALRDILDAHGELLPLATEDGVELSVFNARVVDALDEARSSVMRFPGTDRIMRIKTIAFVESAIRNVDIFRLPHRASSTYVTVRRTPRIRSSRRIAAAVAARPARVSSGRRSSPRRRAAARRCGPLASRLEAW